MQKNEIAVAVEGIPSARDWTEDASHENGNYSCLCCACEKPFIGHKRRVLCRVCHFAPHDIHGASK